VANFARNDYMRADISVQNKMYGIPFHTPRCSSVLSTLRPPHWE